MAKGGWQLAGWVANTFKSLLNVSWLELLSWVSHVRYIKAWCVLPYIILYFLSITISIILYCCHWLSSFSAIVAYVCHSIRSSHTCKKLSWKAAPIQIGIQQSWPISKTNMSQSLHGASYNYQKTWKQLCIMGPNSMAHVSSTVHMYMHLFHYHYWISSGHVTCT